MCWNSYAYVAAGMIRMIVPVFVQVDISVYLISAYLISVYFNCN